MTVRKHLSDKARRELFLARGGRCYLCSGKIKVGEAWEVEHEVALCMGGLDDASNFQLAHTKCHKAKTARDKGQLAKAVRRQTRSIGAHRSRNPMPCGRQSRFKKLFSGRVVER